MRELEYDTWEQQQQRNNVKLNKINTRSPRVFVL